MKSAKITLLPLYPFLFTLWSILSLLSTNKSEVMPIAAIRLTMVMLLVTAIVYFLFLLIFRNKHKAAFLALITLLSFTTYGHLYNAIINSKSLNFLGHHRNLIVLYLVILAVAVIIVLRKKRFEGWTKSLNIILSIAVAIPLAQVLIYYVPQLARSTRSASDSALNNPPQYTLTSENKPDIYYIILDSYTRQDAMMQDFGFDNSTFLDALRERGFFVGDCSRSNYAHTHLSLSSSLNLNYLDDLGVDLSGNLRDKSKLTELIFNSSVSNHLSSLGYKTVTFETGYVFTDIKTADQYYKSPNNLILSPFIEPFEYMYLENSAFLFIMDTQTDFMDHFFKPLVFPYTGQKERVENIFDKLSTVPEIADPKFVFVHLEIPHHPFIFMPDGSINPDRRYYQNGLMPEDELTRIGYTNQVQYVNAEILKIVDEIIASSKQPPIILLQGDHGLLGEDRMQILNAIYLPDGDTQDRLYPSISPVNTFRVIFDEYFGASIPLVEDRSFFSEYENKLDVTEVEETSPTCIGR